MEPANVRGQATEGQCAKAFEALGLDLLAHGKPRGALGLAMPSSLLVRHADEVILAGSHSLRSIRSKPFVAVELRHGRKPRYCG